MPVISNQWDSWVEEVEGLSKADVPITIMIDEFHRALRGDALEVKALASDLIAEIAQLRGRGRDVELVVVSATLPVGQLLCVQRCPTIL